ncbi:MAG TPA: DUF47 family protein [Candidatus Omnitrophota bacterium]|nr:DUF47 family protein [Candidatus Omnitrophota bacterium]HPS19749.1 DUF47 family protein [Candidatus Omnitrophota bacterium]
MFRKFFPRDVNFFNLLNDQIGYAVKASEFFVEIAKESCVNELLYDKMHAIEQEADEACHKIIDQLDKTFITPFDREDIHGLAKEIDDVADMLTTITNRMKVYNVPGSNKHMIEFSIVIQESVKALAAAIRGLSDMKNSKIIKDACVEVNRLENVGDVMRDKVLVDLFEHEKDPIAVIKWKELYEDAETVLDICEDVTHVINSIVVKQA